MSNNNSCIDWVKLAIERFPTKFLQLKYMITFVSFFTFFVLLFFGIYLYCAIGLGYKLDTGPYAEFMAFLIALAIPFLLTCLSVYIVRKVKCSFYLNSIKEEELSFLIKLTKEQNLEKIQTPCFKVESTIENAKILESLKDNSIIDDYFVHPKTGFFLCKFRGYAWKKVKKLSKTC